MLMSDLATFFVKVSRVHCAVVQNLSKWGVVQEQRKLFIVDSFEEKESYKKNDKFVCCYKHGHGPSAVHVLQGVNF